MPAAIVNIADWRGLKPLPGHFSYTLTKAALIAMTRILAIELAPDIRVNAVAPGSILPPPGQARTISNTWRNKSRSSGTATRAT